MAEIYGIQIRDELTTRTMRQTDWTPKPIRSAADLPPQWIGRRDEQCPPALIAVILGSTPVALENRRVYIHREIYDIVRYDSDYIGAPRQMQMAILGFLRYLYLVDGVLLAMKEDASQ